MAQAALKPTNDTGPVYDGPIFDADTHLYETGEAWTKYISAETREKFGVNLRKADDGRWQLFVGNRRVEISSDHVYEEGFVTAPGKLHEWLNAMKRGEDIDMKVPRTDDMIEPAARVRKLDEWNVRSSILYVGNMVGVMSYFDDPACFYEIINGYNRWLLDQWSFNYQNRIFITPVLSLDNLDEACKQARWAVENGARAILMPMGPFNGKAPAHTDHDPFWAILNEAGIRVVFHVGEAIYMKTHMALWGEPVQQPRIRQTAFVWMHGYSERPVVETLSSFIFWNFFERFPNIRLLSAENGAEWVPQVLTKMDKVRGISRNGHWPGGPLKQRPSQIFKENIGVVAYPEDDIRLAIDQTGSADWILMGSDYPHTEGVAEPRMFADEACRDLTAEETRKVMFENGMRFMNLAGGA